MMKEKTVLVVVYGGVVDIVYMDNDEEYRVIIVDHDTPREDAGEDEEDLPSVGYIAPEALAKLPEEYKRLINDVR